MSVASFSRALVRRFEECLNYIGCIAAAISTLLICYEVFTRYVLGFSHASIAEISKYLMICSALLIAGRLTWDNEHFMFNFVSSRLKGRGSQAVTLLIIIVGIIVSAWMFVYSIEYTAMMKDWQQTTESGTILVWWVYSFLVFAMGLTFCYYFALLIRWFLSIFKPGKQE